MHKNYKLYGTATVGARGQVVVPVKAREELGFEEGDSLYAIGSEKGGWVCFVKEDRLNEIISQATLQLESLQKLAKATEN